MKKINPLAVINLLTFAFGIGGPSGSTSTAFTVTASVQEKEFHLRYEYRKSNDTPVALECPAPGDTAKLNTDYLVASSNNVVGSP